MRKLPVFDIAKRAYGFLARDFGMIVRLSWLPLLLVTVVQFFANRSLYANLGDDPAAYTDSFQSMSGLLLWLANIAANFIGTAIVTVALHRVILFGERKPGSWFHLAFGKTELRFAALPFIVIFGGSLAFLLVIYLLGPIFSIYAVLLFFVGMVFLWIRFSLIFPIIVVSGFYDLEQAGKLTRDNFWRLLSLWLLVMGPGYLLLTWVERLIAFGSLITDPAMLSLLATNTPRQVAMSLVHFVLSIALGALGVAVLSYSYKALSGHQPEDVLTRQG
jgi:hypothetical protein